MDIRQTSPLVGAPAQPKKVCCGMTGGKCCVLWTVVGVLVVVLVPISLFVIGPNVAQHILDSTVVALPNSTMNPCETLESWIQNKAKIHVPFFLPSTLLSYKQVLSTTTCGTGPDMQGGFACNNPNVSLLGSYVSPEMKLSGGDNTKSFQVRMDLHDSSTIISGFILPMFFYHAKARLTLTAEDVTISVLGIKMKGLKMRNELTCTGVQQQPAVNIPNSVCYPHEPNHTVYNTNGYYMSCVSGALPLTQHTTTTKKMTTTTTKKMTTTKMKTSTTKNSTKGTTIIF